MTVFSLVGAALVVASNSAVTPLYRLYQQSMHLTPLVAAKRWTPLQAGKGITAAIQISIISECRYRWSHVPATKIDTKNLAISINCWFFVGRDTLRRLNDGALAPERTLPYLLKYLGQHFEDLANYRAHDATGPHHAAFADMLSLLSEGWVRAWQKVDGSYIGFLADVGRVWTRAEESVRTINSPIKISDATCLQINAPMSAASASSSPLPGRRSPVNFPSAVARRSS
jgi:hypothetical protein